MADLQGNIGELHFTLQITRKETGVTETVELVGKISEAQLKEIEEDGRHSLDRSA